MVGGGGGMISRASFSGGDKDDIVEAFCISLLLKTIRLRLETEGNRYKK